MDLQQQLQAIYDQHGTLTPELVVEAARPDNSPLHAYVFDKPPDQAAEAYYRERAHRLIQRVDVLFTSSNGETRRVRAFHAVHSTEGWVYEPLEAVVRSYRLTEAVLAEMEREWRALYARWGHFQEFLDLVHKDVA